MSDFSKRDPELDQMLGVLRKAQPSPQQLEQWSRVTQSARQDRVLKWYQFRLAMAPQLAAAIIIGFAIGAYTVGHSHTANSLTENSEPSATIEQIYAKAE